jgi:hypothetical protein
MAKKRKVAAKKPRKPAAGSAPKSRAKAPPPQRPRSGSSPKSGGNSRGGNFTSFEEAKSAAIDSLIQAIEEAERRLSAVKQAGSHDELQRIAEGPIS